MKLGRVRGIEIGFHYSWLVIALLITLSLVDHFSTVNPQWRSSVVWVSAIVTGVLFFASLIGHELAHALVARRRGVQVRSITLFALGGTANIERESADPRTEFWMGVAGPLASLAFGLLCLGLALLAGWTPRYEPTSPPLAALTWLGYINLALAAFNMIPAFPLDGGRVLRSFLWWRTGDERRATLIATFAGRAFSWMLIGLGVLAFFSASWFSGLWFILLGSFLLEGAQAGRARVEVAEQLRDLRVGDVMTDECPTVDPRESVQTFVDEHLLRSGRRCFVVRTDGHVDGMLTPREVRDTDRAAWSKLTVEDIMRPIDRLSTVEPETLLTEALDRMQTEDVNQLPVLNEDGSLAGIVSRANVVNLLRTRSELLM